MVARPTVAAAPMHRNYSVYVIQNTVHDVIKDVGEASCIVEPSMALLRVTEASAILDTIIRLVGGTQEVSRICDIDVEQLQNTIRRQERQIQDLLLLRV